jgi:hypothetical protein
MASLGFLWFHIVKRGSFSGMSAKNQIIYKAVERELFSLAICWIVFASHRLKSRFVGFLSHPAWQPFGKLSLRYFDDWSVDLLNFPHSSSSMYILQWPYLLYTNNLHRNSSGFYPLMLIFFVDICALVVLAAIAFVLIEAPIKQLMNFSWKSTIQRKTGKVCRC